MRLRRAASLAALALTALLATACGGGSPSDAPSAGHGLPTVQQLDSFASCVRGHGVPNFYFTHDDGGNTPDNMLKIGPWAAPANPGSPQFQAALKACQHLIPRPQLSAAQSQSLQRRLLRQAACMRAARLPGLPGPQRAARRRHHPAAAAVQHRHQLVAVPGGAASLQRRLIR